MVHALDRSPVELQAHRPHFRKSIRTGFETGRGHYTAARNI